jgi:hypothetical protein
MNSLTGDLDMALLQTLHSTLIYAERDEKLARQVAMDIG